MSNAIVVILDNFLRHDVFGFESRLDAVSPSTTREQRQLAGPTCASLEPEVQKIGLKG